MTLQDITNDKMIQELAMMYAVNIKIYGVDVTEKWETATQQAYALNQAYIKGRFDESNRFYRMREEEREKHTEFQKNSEKEVE